MTVDNNINWSRVVTTVSGGGWGGCCCCAWCHYSGLPALLHPVFPPLDRPADPSLRPRVQQKEDKTYLQPLLRSCHPFSGSGSKIFALKVNILFATYLFKSMKKFFLPVPLKNTGSTTMVKGYLLT